ncbi:hypothetical protein RFI_09064 [Reticulomyxa filosa]|uniref:BTB domain-containing protein n=1 Tax=Reticulomyxa filosa TaxID=46433 RepID=X6NQT6_RETFI|nr:hypothetical protein RFI_09064 [Reticulomyxa filosa]|eukprot:ETO28069.1 hypothetical protein RFI_09064 [Reticulomyxa filosa]
MQMTAKETGSLGHQNCCLRLPPYRCGASFFNKNIILKKQGKKRGCEKCKRRLLRYLNRCHSFIRTLEPCFTMIVPYLTIDDLANLSMVCGILSNWMLADVVESLFLCLFLCFAHDRNHIEERTKKKVWRKACLASTQYADLIKQHLRAETWYQLATSLRLEELNPFRQYISGEGGEKKKSTTSKTLFKKSLSLLYEKKCMSGGSVQLLDQCFRKLITNIRETSIANPSILKLSMPPTQLFHTEWLFRCCVSLRNDRHGLVPQGLLPKLFHSILKEYCCKYASLQVLHVIPLRKRTLRWLVSEWHIYEYIVDRLTMLSQKIDDHNYQYEPNNHFVPPPPHDPQHPHYASFFNALQQNPHNIANQPIYNSAALAAAISASYGAECVCLCLAFSFSHTLHIAHYTLHMLFQTTKKVHFLFVCFLKLKWEKKKKRGTHIIKKESGFFFNRKLEKKSDDIKKNKDLMAALMHGRRCSATVVSKKKRRKGWHQVVTAKHTSRAFMRLHKALYAHCPLNVVVNRKLNLSSHDSSIDDLSGILPTPGPGTTVTTTTTTSSIKGNKTTKTTTTITSDGKQTTKVTKETTANDLLHKLKSHPSPMVRGEEEDDASLQQQHEGGDIEQDDDDDDEDDADDEESWGFFDSDSSNSESYCNCAACALGIDASILNKDVNELKTLKYIASIIEETSTTTANANTASATTLSNKHTRVNPKRKQHDSPKKSNPHLNTLPHLSILPPHLSLFAKYFLCADVCVYVFMASIKKKNHTHLYKHMYTYIEQQKEHRLLAEVCIILDSIGVRCPKKWMPSNVVNRQFYHYADTKMTIVFKGHVYQLDKRAASLSPYLREFMGREYHCAVDLSWMDGDQVYFGKLLQFLEYHVNDPLPHIPTPVQSKNCAKDCFVMILIGNGLAISPLVHLFCARIATMIKSLSDEDVDEIMSEEKPMPVDDETQRDRIIDREKQHLLRQRQSWMKPKCATLATKLGHANNQEWHIYQHPNVNANVNANTNTNTSINTNANANTIPISNANATNTCLTGFRHEHDYAEKCEHACECADAN